MTKYRIIKLPEEDNNRCYCVVELENSRWVELDRFCTWERAKLYFDIITGNHQVMMERDNG